MIASLYCGTCHRETGITPEEEFSAELNDDLLLVMNCPKGHTDYTCVANTRFQILFDVGMYALYDGYTREAVSSYAASMERFHEFCIRVFLSAGRINQGDIETAWKQVAKQSERQLGGYVFLYLINMKSMPQLLPQKMVEFRNDVIHKGRIPSTVETTTYASSVYETMRSTIQRMERDFKDVMTSCYTDEVNNRKGRAPDPQLVSVFSGLSYLPFPEWDECLNHSFEQRCKELGDCRWLHNRK